MLCLPNAMQFELCWVLSPNCARTHSCQQTDEHNASLDVSSSSLVIKQDTAC